MSLPNMLWGRGDAIAATVQLHLSSLSEQKKRGQWVDAIAATVQFYLSCLPELGWWMQ